MLAWLVDGDDDGLPNGWHLLRFVGRWEFSVDSQSKARFNVAQAMIFSFFYSQINQLAKKLFFRLFSCVWKNYCNFVYKKNLLIWPQTWFFLSIHKKNILIKIYINKDWIYTHYWMILMEDFFKLLSNFPEFSRLDLFERISYCLFCPVILFKI